MESVADYEEKNNFHMLKLWSFVTQMARGMQQLSRMEYDTRG